MHQRHEDATAENRAAGLAQSHPQEGPDPAEAETAGDLFVAGIGAAQTGRHRQVDERIDGEGHHQDRAAETLDPGGQRRPAEADHEVRDGERDHHEHGPEWRPGRSVRSTHQPPACRSPRTGRSRRPSAAPCSKEGVAVSGPPDQAGDRRHARAVRLDEQEDERARSTATTATLAPSRTRACGAGGRPRIGAARRRRRRALAATGSEGHSRPACLSSAMAAEPSPSSPMVIG